MGRRIVYALSVVVLALWCVATRGAERTAILFDTDIGTGIDDAFALGYALASPDIDLRGVTTVGSKAEDRAWIVCRFLTHVGRKDVPVAFGRDKQPDEAIDWQIQYRRHPAVVWNRTMKPSKLSAVELMHDVLKADPGKVTIVACGPLTNVAALLAKYPEAKGWIKRVVFVPDVVDCGRPWSNLTADPAASDVVLTAEIPVIILPAPSTHRLILEPPALARLFAARTAVTYQVQSLFELWDQPLPPTLASSLAVAVAAAGEGDGPYALQDVKFSSGHKANYKAVAVTNVDEPEFVKRYIAVLQACGVEILPKEPGNVTKLIDRGMLPNRVHAFEDYETDIEKRWWMTGKLEIKDVPVGSKRACRAVLTQDYDDLQGDMRATYRAVIFNPVPGPPMGANTRLAFRYKLHGTGTLRVQLFSLANGYHRYLSLADLPQDKWMEGAVDMTQMRRPDGSGGPLAADERIDDIQFYIDPRAELLIDDVVLYDAAPAGETRPFPKNFLYTGWFDTGKQGGEWPGDFEIVKHEPPLTWKAAKSIVDPKSGASVLRLGLRGSRALPLKTQLKFRYLLTAAPADASLDLALIDTKSGGRVTGVAKGLKVGAWRETTIDFTSTGAPATINQIQLAAPKGATLLIDDVLLYEPAGP